MGLDVTCTRSDETLPAIVEDARAAGVSFN
jgi:hypothetical protein